MKTITFFDNINAELQKAGWHLTEQETSAILDLVLERAAEIFEAHTKSYQPGSVFPPYYVASFVRNLKTNENHYRTNNKNSSST